MRFATLLVCCGWLGACADATVSPDTSVSRSSPGNLAVSRVVAGTYVLMALDAQTVSPFLLSDLPCASTRYTTYLAADTIEIQAGGIARRSFTLVRAVNGVLEAPSATAWAGTWQEFDATGWYYFGGSPAIRLSGTINGRSVGGNYRVDAPDALSAPTAVGGTCGVIGDSPTPPREVVAIYRLR